MVELIFIPAMILDLLIGLLLLFMIIRYWCKQNYFQRCATLIIAAFLLSQANYWLFNSWTMLHLGGMPSIGKISNGHYFVGDHSRYTEVSFQTYKSYLGYERSAEWLLDLNWILLIFLGATYGLYRWRHHLLEVEK